MVWLLEKAATKTPVPKTETRCEEDEELSFDNNGHMKNLNWTKND